MLQEFKPFVLHGNVSELAVAVVIETAFGAIDTSLAKRIITPLAGVLSGQSDSSGPSLTLNGSGIRYGTFLNALSYRF